MSELNIEYYLEEKIRKIESDIANDRFNNRDTEEFFTNLLNRVFRDKYKFRVLGVTDRNSKGIDSFDKESKIGVQITAQKSSENIKIENTISRTIKNWQDKVDTLWIFFITITDEIKKIDTENLFEIRDGIKVYIKTYKSLLSEISNKHIDEKREINEFVKQHISEEYKGIISISEFRQIKEEENLVNNQFFDSEIVYFSKKEFSTLKYLEQNFNSERIKEYAILGNPGNGKTTFANFIKNKIKRKIFFIDLSSPQINYKNLKEDLIQISHFHSFIIVDNIHDNIDLFKKIKNNLNNYAWIQSLYLSRYYKTIDEFNSENIYEQIKGIPFFRIDNNEDFNDKVFNVIDAKISKLKIRFPNLKWFKGNFNKIISNSNRSLLKLNIALKVWESKNNQKNELKLDEIDSPKILQYFYLNAEIEKVKKDELFFYTFLYKNDISFIPLVRLISYNEELKEKGILLQYPNSDYCYFPHKDYAKLIFDSLMEINKSNPPDLRVFFEEYIQFFNQAENELYLYSILTKLYFSNLNLEKLILKYLINQDFVCNHFKNNRLEYFYQNQNLLKIVFEFRSEIDDEILRTYYNIIYDFFKKEKLNLYLKNDFIIFNYLKTISNDLNIHFSDIEICIVLKSNEYCKLVKMVDITHLISRKNYSPKTINRVLNSFDYQEWLRKFQSIQKFSTLTNCLSELRTNNETKKLLNNLIRDLDWNNIVNEIHTLKIDQISKSLVELNEIDSAVNTNIRFKVFTILKNKNLFNLKFEKSNLSEYSKTLSDIRKFDLKFVYDRLIYDIRKENIIELIRDEKSKSNLDLRINELRRTFITIIDNFKHHYKIKLLIEFQNHHLKKRIINNVFVNKEDFNINNFIQQKNINSLEGLFKQFNINDKVKFFNDINSKLFVRKLINFQIGLDQGLQLLSKLKQEINTPVINDKIKIITENYIKNYKNDKERYNKIGINNFLMLYYFAYSIDNEICEKFFKNDFVEIFKKDNTDGVRIGQFFQYLKFLSYQTDEFDEDIRTYLYRNTSNFLNLIKLEDVKKILSGFSELKKTRYSEFADDLLKKSKNSISKKINQEKGTKIYKTKLIPDLQKILNEENKKLYKLII
jgi:hypothetical protein